MTGKGLRLRRSISVKYRRDRFADRHGNLGVSSHSVYAFPEADRPFFTEKSFAGAYKRFEDIE